MKRIEEIKKQLVKRATGFITGGFRPTNSNTESWIGQVYLYRESEDIPIDDNGKAMLPLLQICLEELPYIPDTLKGSKVLTVFVSENMPGRLAYNGDDWVIREYKEEDVLVALSTLHPVAGRFDAVRSKDGVTAIVDYAHTPDALTNVLNAIHGVLEGKGKVITVVGAGGNRDKGKRPIMAKEAAKASDRVIITSDNPRFEEPQDIINDMLAGLDAEDMRKTLSIADRKEAIRTACMLAEKGDVILIAGKGHENYQEIKGVKHHFDDKEEVKRMLND